MAREYGKVRQDTYDNNPEGSEKVPRSNRRGELVVCDFWTQLMLDGRIFHMQVGTESAGVNTTTTAADTLVMMVVDGLDGWTLLPVLYEVSVDAAAAATQPEAYLEIDNAKVRYNTGGTAFVPENLRTDRPRTSVAASAYVGTDITTNAKTAVPGSIEIGHHTFWEDAIATPTGAELHHYVISAKERPLPAVVGIGSILGHFGASTADATGFACLQWAEVESENVT
ncbi:MAG: hypothetical protein ACYTEX_23310 [Planctomycetota bacterium]|jgi:hypothetical protein